MAGYLKNRKIPLGGITINHKFNSGSLALLKGIEEWQEI
jgi:hypothetical protein